MRTIIIGGGAGGSGCAARLRRLDENMEILILEKTEETSIASCGLPYYIGGVIAERNKMQVAKPEMMKSLFNIEIKLNSEVTEINPQNKSVTTKDGESYPYDKLVIATGAVPFIPKIKGLNSLPHFAVKHLSDADNIKTYIKEHNIKQATVVGGGFIGVEVAENLHHLGIETTLVEMMPQILPPMDEDTVCYLEQEMQKAGIKLELGDGLSEIIEGGLVLNSGKLIQTEMVILALGVRPVAAIALKAGIKLTTKGSIVTNEYMQTNVEDIYACGDNVETPVLQTRGSRLGGNASIAVKQARVVAENLAGHEEEFKPVLGTSAVRLFGLSVVMSGSSEEFLRRQTGKLYHKIHLWQNNYASYIPGNEKMLFKVMFASDGHILGIEGIGGSGVDKRVDVVSSVMHHHGTYKEMMSAEIAYSPFFATAKDAVNNMGSMIEGVVRDGVKYVFIESLDWSQAGREIMLIDTRSHEAFRGGHLPGAVNLPLADFRKHLSFVPRDKMVVLYCNSGYGAYNAYCLLAHHGYDNIYLLSGSLDLYTEIMADKEN